MLNDDNNLFPDESTPESQFDVLIHEYLDGQITQDRAELLRNYLADRDNVRYFVQRCMQEQIVYELISSNLYKKVDNAQLEKMMLMQEFANYEKLAPEIEMKIESDPQEEFACLQRDTIPSPPPVAKRINPWVVVSFMITVAAIIYSFRYAEISPPAKQIEVATITDIVRAKWGDSTPSFSVENRLLTDQPVTIPQGLIEIKTDRDVTVMVEGPAQFAFNSNNEMTLSYGHLFSEVSRKGYGFTVKTPDAMVVDLGTAFSLNVEHDSQKTDVYMYEGSAAVSNSENTTSSEIIKQGQARRVNRLGSVQQISFDNQTFMNRELSNYEKLLCQSKVSAYCNLNKNSDWINKYIGDYNLKRHATFNNTSYLNPDQNDTSFMADSYLYFNSTPEQKTYVSFDNIPEYADDSFTVAFWFKIDNSKPVEKQFIASKFLPMRQIGWRIGLLNNKLFIRLSAKHNGTQYHNYIHNPQPLDNGWHWVVMVVNRQKGLMTGFLDGSSAPLEKPTNLQLLEDAEYRTAPISQTIPTDLDVVASTPLHVGIRSVNMAHPFNGWIYDLALWDRPLSEKDIQQIYKSFPLAK